MLHSEFSPSGLSREAAAPNKWSIKTVMAHSLARQISLSRTPPLHHPFPLFFFNQSHLLLYALPNMYMFTPTGILGVNVCISTSIVCMHHLLTLMVFQTYMNFFYCRTLKKIFWRKKPSLHTMKVIWVQNNTEPQWLSLYWPKIKNKNKKTLGRFLKKYYFIFHKKMHTCWEQHEGK